MAGRSGRRCGVPRAGPEDDPGRPPAPSTVAPRWRERAVSTRGSLERVGAPVPADPEPGDELEGVSARCAGLDGPTQSVVAGVLVGAPGAEAAPAVGTCGTLTDALEGLARWLREAGCTQVAMESTGVSWKPVWNVLEEGGVKVLLVNAQHVKIVPGRKTDGKDGEWLADLVRHGLVRGSFVPDREQRELRELTRYRTELIESVPRKSTGCRKPSRRRNQAGSVVSDLTGVSAGRCWRCWSTGTGSDRHRAGGAGAWPAADHDPGVPAGAARAVSSPSAVLAGRVAVISITSTSVSRPSVTRSRSASARAPRSWPPGHHPGIGHRVAEIVIAEIGANISDSLPRAISPPGAGLPGQQRKCRQTRRAARPARATPPSAVPSLKPPAPPAGRAPISAPSSTASNRGVAPSGPPSPLLTPASASATSSSPARPTTSTSAPTTSTAVTPLPPSASSSVASNASATRSPSRRSLDQTRRPIFRTAQRTGSG